MAIASSEAAPVEAKVVPVEKAVPMGIYASTYEHVETSDQEVEDGADDVFDMLLQVPEKAKQVAPAKVAPKVVEQKLAPPNGATIYEAEYMEPPSAEETLDSMDSVFDSMVQVDATYEDSRPTPNREQIERAEQHRAHRVHAAKKHAAKKYYAARRHAAKKLAKMVKPAKKKPMARRHGGTPVKAHTFHGKGVKDTELEEEDEEEPEPEDDSFDRDEPIGAGAGDFVEEEDDEEPKEFQEEEEEEQPARTAPAKVEVIEEKASKAAPAPVHIGLKQDKEATVALAVDDEQTTVPGASNFNAPSQSGLAGDGFSIGGGNIVNPAIHEMKAEEYQESKRRKQRRAKRNVLLKAYRKLEYAGDTKEEKYRRVKAADRATEELDEIQGIDPVSGRVKAWMSKCSDGADDC